MQLFDTVAFSGTRRTADGYLVADAKVARTGIQLYSGSEVGRPDLATVRVYRSPEEVFSKDAMQSYSHRPVTLNHPDGAVTADNWRDLARGQTGDEVVRDGEFVRVPMVLMDAAAIREVESGTRQLSMGYQAEIVFADGVTPSGEPYDAVQKSLRMNHLAIVANARGGSSLKIGDSLLRGSEMAEATKTKTVLVDGLPIETTDAGAIVIEKLQGDVKAAATALTDAETKHAKTLAAKDAEIDALKAKVLTDAALDARVSARADLITKAKHVAPAIVTDGKPDADIRKAAVVAKLGDAAVADKSQAYIDARFDILVEDAGVDPFKQALKDGKTTLPADIATVYADRDTALSNAWKTPEKKEA
jgi:hypothetical protein